MWAVNYMSCEGRQADRRLKVAMVCRFLVLSPPLLSSVRDYSTRRLGAYVYSRLGVFSLLLLPPLLLLLLLVVGMRVMTVVMATCVDCFEDETSAVCLLWCATIIYIIVLLFYRYITVSGTWDCTFCRATLLSLHMPQFCVALWRGYSSVPLYSGDTFSIPPFWGTFVLVVGVTFSHPPYLCTAPDLFSELEEDRRAEGGGGGGRTVVYQCSFNCFICLGDAPDYYYCSLLSYRAFVDIHAVHAHSSRWLLLAAGIRVSCL